MVDMGNNMLDFNHAVLAAAHARCRSTAFRNLALAVKNIRLGRGSIASGVHLHCARVHVELAWTMWSRCADSHLRRRLVFVQRLVDSFGALVTLGAA